MEDKSTPATVSLQFNRGQKVEARHPSKEMNALL